jgi:hypothetical protein
MYFNVEINVSALNIWNIYSELRVYYLQKKSETSLCRRKKYFMNCQKDTENKAKLVMKSSCVDLLHEIYFKMSESLNFSVFITYDYTILR